ncbi:acyltransferase [Serratia nevei]|uniref:acyltransferase family protein n=1 Tax=Serratia nevei TaxID=2703794 RepID=UPI0020A1A646|nr:acyltransferase family protein [Serratia nevei]MCP1106402.1 acyltransferase [Serratia nevei]
MKKPLQGTVHRYRKDIDGLRAIAILLVVLYHTGVKQISGGFIGVDIFFVISGFLIGGILHREHSQGQFSYLNFYSRRIKRIAPALLFMLTVISVIATLYLSPLEMKDFSLFSGATILSVPNIILWHKTNYFSPNAELNPLLMTWSLGVEEQFYIFLPLLLGFLFRKKLNVLFWIAAITLLSFITCIFVTQANPLFAFFMLPTRAWELGMGVWLAIAQQQHRLPAQPAWLKELQFILGSILIILSASYFSSETAFPGAAALLPTLGTLLLILGNGRLSGWLLGNPLMVFIGLVSYSWYLWHWPLLSFARLAANQPLSLGATLAISTVALAIAYISYRFIETPFRQGWRYQENKVIGGYLSLIAILMLPTSIFYLTEGATQPVSAAVTQAEADKLERVADKCLIGQGNTSYSTESVCLDSSKNAGIALLGDSHAASLRGGVDHYAKQHQLSVYQLTKATCPMLIGVFRTMKAYPSHAAECAEYNAKALDFVINNPKIKNVIIAASWDSGIINGNEGYSVSGKKIPKVEALALGLKNVVEKLNGAGKNVILVEDVPYIKFNTVKALDNEKIPLRKLVATIFSPPATAVEYHTDDYTKKYSMPTVNLERLMTPYKDRLLLDIVPPAKSLCNENGCQFKENGRLLYYDNQHMTYIGGMIALRDLTI